MGCGSDPTIELESGRPPVFPEPGRRLASDCVETLPGHPDPALSGPSCIPFLGSLLILLLAGFLAFRCLRRFRDETRSDSFRVTNESSRSGGNRAERMV